MGGELTPETNIEIQKLVVGRCFSFCKEVFSGSILLFGGVNIKPTTLEVMILGGSLLRKCP